MLLYVLFVSGIYITHSYILVYLLVSFKYSPPYTHFTTISIFSYLTVTIDAFRRQNMSALYRGVDTESFDA
jgi:hypothetical protein